MTRIEVLKSIILAVAAAQDIEPASIVVHEVISDHDRLLSPHTGLLVTVSSSENVRNVRPGTRVVVLHSQDARELDVQLACLLEIDVGFIVIPNVDPAAEDHQIHPRSSSVWTGDGWKAVARVRRTSNRRVVTVDGDHGTAVIFPVSRLGFVTDYELPAVPTWTGLVEHRAEWLGIVSPEQLAELLVPPVVETTPASAESEASTTVGEAPAIEPAPAEPTPATLDPVRASRRRRGAGRS